jgi:hypothetical protein
LTVTRPGALEVARDWQLFYDPLYGLLQFLVSSHGDFERIHLFNSWFALVMYVFAFEVLLGIFRDQRLAIMGPLMIFAIPRLTGCVPFDPKDAPFAVLYCSALCAMYSYWFRRKGQGICATVGLGFLIGSTLCLRLAGLTLLVLLIIGYGYARWVASRDVPTAARGVWVGWKDAVMRMMVIGCISLAMLTSTWPYLWSDWYKHFMQLLQVNARFEWEIPMLFFGHVVSNLSLPRWYLPFWILVTTPLFILSLWILSLLPGLRAREPSFTWFLWAAVALNLALYYIVHPTIYDGLRHYLFLLPVVGLLAALSFIELWKRRMKNGWWRLALALILLNASQLVLDQTRFFPYQYTYFNELVGGTRGAAGRFEIDHYGIALKEATLWLRERLASEPERTFKIGARGYPWQTYYYYRDASNMAWTDQDAQMDYFICPTRLQYHLKYDPSRIVHTVQKEGIPLACVFRLRP